MKKLKQVELMPLPHGGKRERAGRKPVASELKGAFYFVKLPANVDTGVSDLNLDSAS